MSSLQLAEDPHQAPAFAMKTNLEKGSMLAAVDYITKPFNPDLVKARVEAQFLHFQTED
jgi:DNA-binding response OmpR family regulator